MLSTPLPQTTLSRLLPHTMLSSNRLPQTLLSPQRFPQTMLSPAKLLQTMLLPFTTPIRLLPQTMLVAHNDELAQTMFVAVIVGDALPQTMLSLPQTIVVDHAAALLKSTSPQTTFSPQTTVRAHGQATPANTACDGIELRSHHSPGRADVSIALASATAPWALSSPAPCVTAS